MGLAGPRYGIREEKSFEEAKVKLWLTEKELDDHLFAIQDAILPDPFAEPWSVASRLNPDIRVAVSDATDAFPDAIRILYRVEGNMICLLHVELRDE